MQRRQGAYQSSAQHHLFPFATQPHDPVWRFHNAFCGRPADQQDEVWRNQLHLPLQEGPATFRLLQCRRSVARRPPVDDVGDMDIIFREADRGQHTIEKLACASDERHACQILVTPGGLADNHQAGRGRAAIKAGVLGGCAQSAPFELRNSLAQVVERLGRSGNFARRRRPLSARLTSSLSAAGIASLMPRLHRCARRHRPFRGWPRSRGWLSRVPSAALGRRRQARSSPVHVPRADTG